MDLIDREDLQWKVAMFYFIVSIAAFTWWMVGQIMTYGGYISTVPDSNLDLYRLVIGAVSFFVGMLRLRWREIRYPTISS